MVVLVSAYLYVPDKGRCYEAFRQGPCTAGQYLTLPEDSAIPKCESNYCNRDGQVRFNGRCYGLGTKGPCGLAELNSVIGVNETTLQVQCIVPSHLPQPSMALHTRFGDDDLMWCYNGSRRAYENKCGRNSSE